MRGKIKILLRCPGEVAAENQRGTAQSHDRHHHTLPSRSQTALAEVRGHLERTKREHVKVGPERIRREILKLIPALKLLKIGLVMVPGVRSDAHHVSVFFERLPVLPTAFSSGRKT